MISPETIRRYPFFSGLSHENIVALADSAEEFQVEIGYLFFHQGEQLQHFYLVLKGAVSILVDLPDETVKHTVSEQLTGSLKMREVVASKVEPGEVFGWSGLVPPHTTTASARALAPSTVIAFDCLKLLDIFQEDCKFGYLMMLKAAQLIRERLRDKRIEAMGVTVERERAELEAGTP